MKKRALSLLLALVITLTILPLAAFAEEEPNDTKETATLAQLNDTVSGYISAEKNPNGILAAADTDWFKYEIPAAGLFEITLMPGYKSDILVYERWIFTLYNEDGEQLSSEKVDILGGAEKKMTGVITDGKCTIYLRVTSEDSFSSSHTIINKRKYIIKNKYTCYHEGHQTDTQLSTPTCSKEGVIEFRCDDCGEVSKKEYLEKLPHTPAEEWEVTKEPTCAVSGRRVKVCLVCGETAETEDLPKLKHTPAKEWETVRETSCREPGLRILRCTVCGGRAQEEEIPQLKHSFGDWKTTQKPTCISTGTSVHVCSVCGREEKKRLSETEHDFGEWIIANNATCERDGERVRVCAYCNYNEREKIPKRTEHDFGEWMQLMGSDGKPITNIGIANCDQEIREFRICKSCAKEDVRMIPGPGHTYEETQGGKMKCKRCGETITWLEWKRLQEKEEKKGKEITVTKANSTTPTVIVIVVPAFHDVSSSAWYQNVVAYAYNLGLMVGNSETSFNPTGNMTLAEAITMACRARNSYKGGTNADFKASKVWYQTYVDYALEEGILKKGDFDDYERPATRAEMAYLFAHALPDEGMKAINTVEKLPDVKESDSYGKEIFTLYRAGVLTGQDKQGTFAPESPITRAEAAAIITRVTLSSERKSLELK